MPKFKKLAGSKFSSYFDPKHPGSFSGVSGFLKNNKVNRKKFKEWARKENTLTLHKPARKRFPRRRVLVFSTGDLMQIDLIDFQKLSKYNKGFKYVLVAIDVFSKFASAKPLKSKTATEVLKAVKLVVKDIHPKKIQTDRGLEFVNKTLSQWLKSQNIQLYSTFNYDIKACVVERFIRTLKDRLYRYFTENTTNTYIGVLAKIVDSYNSSFHRSIKMTPKQARKAENEQTVYDNLYSEPVSDQKVNLKVNDTVRVSRYPSPFLKSCTPNFSQEYFYIDAVVNTVPPVYKLRDVAGEKLAGSFYTQELQKITVDYDKPFKIQAVLARKKNKVLVKYLGWPTKFNEWIPKKTSTEGIKQKTLPALVSFQYGSNCASIHSSFTLCTAVFWCYWILFI